LPAYSPGDEPASSLGVGIDNILGLFELFGFLAD